MPSSGFRDDVGVLGVEALHVGLVARHQRRRDELRELEDGELLRGGRAARGLLNTRAPSRSAARAGAWRRSTRCRTRRVLAHHDGSGVGDAASRAGSARNQSRASPVSARARAHAPSRMPPRRQVRSWGARRRRARRARRPRASSRRWSPVDLERLERIGDEQQLHHRGSAAQEPGPPLLHKKGERAPATTPEGRADARERQADSVTRKVISALSRCASSCSASGRPLPMLPSSAGRRSRSPARAGTRRSTRRRRRRTPIRAVDRARDGAARSGAPDPGAPRGPCRWPR